MKKTIKLLLLTVFACTLTACSNNSADTQENNSDDKTFQVEVVHSDGSTNTFTYTSDEEYLGDVLLEEGLIEGEDSSYGLYVTSVDGESADYDENGSWWALSQDGELTSTGVSEVAVEDGETYTWTYTID
jgi:hypothetical protein